MLDFILLICIYTGIFAISSIGLNLIVGYAGLLSLCQAAFLAIGAYSTAILMTAYGTGFFLSMIISGLTASVMGLLIGIPSLRLKGDYLAIATLGFGEIVKNIILNWDSLTKGPMGINGIPGFSIAGTTLTYMDKQAWAILIWIIVAISYYLIRRTVRSRIGRALEAIREDEIAASAMGINTAKYKVGAFTFGAFLAGIAGSIFACFNQSVAPLTFDFMMSIMILCMAVLGGLGNSFATLIGTVIIIITSELPRLLGISHIIPPQLNQILFCSILIIMMIYRPQGLIGRIKINYAKIMKEEISSPEK